ncbi:TonB-dependent receptor [uncultured Paraglaciecola sp.]|uniref:TonB-dependent receptor n=1 Tax=uncultured Paraglaciecola sp. TaxID=1765024 RepID=UPI0030D95B69|tara:strand:+ start:52520 stop:55492 length:2973 start_codon:yes stop_codon:yes gene_type:complete
MKKFKPSLMTLSLLAAGLTLHSGASFAQETDAAAEPESELEVIQVKGFRGSVIKSLNTKRFADTVVDAISADDIGGLPDVSIADALTRLPGVTSVRRDGQSSELNIRGLSGGFVLSTLNGREQVSSSGGRSVEFDQFPSELISAAQVYKSQKASLIEGGVAGTVELKTASALDNEEDQKIRLSAHGNTNNAVSDSEYLDSIGQRFTASYQAKMLDDTFGVSVGVALMKQPTVANQFISLQFDEYSEELNNSFSSEHGGIYDGLPEQLFVSDGFELHDRGGEDTRNAVVIALNWEPRDDLRFQFDGFHSKFDSEKFDRGLRVDGLSTVRLASLGGTPNGGVLTNPILSGNTLLGGTFSRDPNNMVDAPPALTSQYGGIRVQTQADDATTESSVSSWGLKGEWDVNDDLSVTVDVAHSEGDEDSKDRVMRMAYFEDASIDTPVIDDGLVVQYQLNGLKSPNVSFNRDFTDLDHMMVVAAEAYPRIESNSSDAIKIDFKYELDNEFISSVEAGLRSSKREYSLERGRFVYGVTDQTSRSGQYITYGQDADGNTIEVERFQPYQLSSDEVTISSLGGDFSNMPQYLAVDVNQILDSWIPNVDQTPTTDWNNAWTLTQNNVIEENVTAAYIQANIDAELGDFPVRGNFGIRAVETEQKSTGLIDVGPGNGDPIADDNGLISTNYVQGTEGTTYTDYLPSLNLTFSLNQEQLIRFAAAKVLSRPDMDTLALVGGISINEREGSQFLDYNSETSPFLRPFYANQIDISYEHYFSETDGAFVVALWNKDITNFVGTVTEKDFDLSQIGFDIPPLFDENDVPIQLEDGNYTHAENNGEGGYMRGIEVAYTQTFSFLPDLWSGLGININWSYTDSEITRPSAVPGEAGSDAPLEGLSNRVFSGTLFYDYDEKLNARVSVRHRGPYLSQQIAIGSEQSAYFNEETIYSAQMSYNFSENLQAVVSVDNLTDEPNISYFGETNRTGTIQYFGRTVYFGVNYNL